MSITNINQIQKYTENGLDVFNVIGDGCEWNEETAEDATEEAYLQYIEYCTQQMALAKEGLAKRRSL